MRITEATDLRDIMDCPICQGSGKTRTGNRKCRECGGIGKVESDLGALARAIMGEPPMKAKENES